jgi:hypothetical protein
MRRAAPRRRATRAAPCRACPSLAPSPLLLPMGSAAPLSPPPSLAHCPRLAAAPSLTSLPPRALSARCVPPLTAPLPPPVPPLAPTALPDGTLKAARWVRPRCSCAPRGHRGRLLAFGLEPGTPRSRTRDSALTNPGLRARLRHGSPPPPLAAAAVLPLAARPPSPPPRPSPSPPPAPPPAVPPLQPWRRRLRRRRRLRLLSCRLLSRRLPLSLHPRRPSAAAVAGARYTSRSALARLDWRVPDAPMCADGPDGRRRRRSRPADALSTSSRGCAAACPPPTRAAAPGAPASNVPSVRVLASPMSLWRPCTGIIPTPTTHEAE